MSTREFLIGLVELFEEHLEGDFPPDAVDFYEEFIELMNRHHIPVSSEMMGISYLFDVAIDNKKVKLDDDELPFEED